MKKDYCHVTMLLDRSSSMEKIKDEIIGGVREFIAKQKNHEGECTLTLIQFDSQDPHEVVIDRKPVARISPEEVQLQPRDCTPLRDALGKSINSTGQWLASLPEDQRPDQVVFVTVTDGLENASRRFTPQQIREMIDRQEQQYNWQFIYLGANQDAVKVGADAGMDQKLCADYDDDPVMIRAAFAATADNVGLYREEKTSGALHYKADQLKKMSSKHQ